MDSVGEELERLARLRASGDLSDEEYELLKSRVIDSTADTSPTKDTSDDEPPMGMDSEEWEQIKEAEVSKSIHSNWSDYKEKMMEGDSFKDIEELKLWVVNEWKWQKAIERFPDELVSRPDGQGLYAPAISELEVAKRLREGRVIELDENWEPIENAPIEQETDIASEPLYKKSDDLDESTEEKVPTARYGIRGLGLTISWLSGIAVLLIAYTTLAQFQLANLMTQFDSRATLFKQREYISDVERVEDVEGATIGLALLLGLIVFILLLFWSWRATKNIQAWAGTWKRAHTKLRRGAGWSVGGWFIPIGFFWIPYQTIKDAWERAPFFNSWGNRVDNSSSNGVWLVAWLTWLATNLVSSRITRTYLDSETPKDFEIIYYVDASFNIVLVISVICFIITINKISKRHSAVK